MSVAHDERLSRTIDLMARLIAFDTESSKSNLPIGLQLLAPAFAEENLLRTARVFERETDWHTRRPGLS